ncbi:MAG: HNH endonuclease signature motif containing protein [Bryobacteraceae bacterium]
MNQELSRAVRERAAHRCEYCSLPETSFPLPFQIDHIRAEKHGGQTSETNLALACPHCNRHKGPNIAGFDAETGQIVRLFNPRMDSWGQHFEINGAQLSGKTPIGRVTVDVLGMNSADQLLVRNALSKEA